jgi:putative ABC transport system substrate-binding protein
MRRRDFIAFVGSGAAVWPLKLNAYRSATPVVGFLYSGSRPIDLEESFKQGLKETGFVEGQTVSIEYRWANGQYGTLPALASDLVHRPVDVIAAVTPVAALAAQAATTSIPIVFGVGSDPVKDGLVASLSRPGGNVTGATFFANLLPAKRTEVLHELDPNARVFGLLSNPKNANAELENTEVQKAARVLGLQLVLLDASNEAEIDKCFGSVAEQHVDAIVVSGDPLFYSRRGQIAEWAIRNRVPTSFPTRQQAVSGGLISYGASISELLRQVGIYVGRILKGERPADLPILQPTKFEFVINIKTAKTLGISIPSALLATADEVIE